MDRVVLGTFALVSFYIAYAYLFKPDLAAHWDSSQRRARGLEAVKRDQAWERRARRRGLAALALGLFLVGIVTGVL
jgi:hypothetical protein